MNANDLKEARKVVAEHRDGVLTSHFERIGKGKVTYSSIQPTKAETRYNLPVHGPVLQVTDSQTLLEPKLFVGYQRVIGHSKLLPIVDFLP